MSAPPFEPENPLELSLLAARREELEIRDLFSRLLESPVWLKLAEAPGPDAKGLPLQLVSAEDGRELLPLFTSRVRLERVHGPGPLAEVEFAELAGNWPGEAWALIAPGEEVEMAVPPTDVRDLARLTGPESMPAGTRVFVGDPAEEPEELLGQLSAWAKAEPSVRAAYRAQVLFDRPGEEPHVAVGLLLDSGADEEALMAAAGERARSSGAHATLLRIDEASSDPIGRYMLDKTEPFYVRGEGA